MVLTHSLAAEVTDFGGALIEPDDPEYDEARRVYNAMIDRRPALIARAASIDDVRAVVAVARRHDLPLAVRGGGHNGAGLGTCDDGIVLDLRELRTVRLAADARTVDVGGGATWGEVDATTGPLGLATPSGIISTTGVGGLTLGGGLGHLSRAYGLTIDSLLGADVVLADGRLVRADADQHPDLYWALRGGGGNFGVVASFTFALHDVSRFAGGPMLWPTEQARDLLTAYRDALPALPRTVNGFFAFLQVPPGAPFPESMWSRRVCGVFWSSVHGAEEARAAMAPFLDAVPAPLLDGFAAVPYPAMQSAFDGVYPAGDQWYWRADFVDALPDAAIEAHARFGSALPTPQSTMHLYPIDGAVHDVGSADTAFAYRADSFASVFAGVDHDPANADLVRRWSIDYFDALHPYSAGGAYVNMMMDEGDARIRASYRDNFDRLARVKRAYDPENVFRVNQNIPPAA